jgi:hypothetical protein
MLGEAQTEVANANSQSSAASGGGSVTTNNISNGGASTMIVPQSSPFNMNETATILR